MPFNPITLHIQNKASLEFSLRVNGELEPRARGETDLSKEYLGSGAGPATNTVCNIEKKKITFISQGLFSSLGK